MRAIGQVLFILGAVWFLQELVLVPITIKDVIKMLFATLFMLTGLITWLESTRTNRLRYKEEEYECLKCGHVHTPPHDKELMEKLHKKGEK